MPTHTSPRTVLVIKGRRYALATNEQMERLRDLNLSRLLTCLNGEWFIDDGPIGTAPIREPSEDRDRSGSGTTASTS